MGPKPRNIRCGGLVRDVRRRHRLSQRQLAERASTTQPVVSGIERDEVSPTLETLNRLMESMGEALVISAIPLYERPPHGGNRSIAELRADFRALTPAERLAQGAELSEIATELAGSARA
jgi:transcriptional regulator with XRE-family HTH domain